MTQYNHNVHNSHANDALNYTRNGAARLWATYTRKYGGAEDYTAARVVAASWAVDSRIPVKVVDGDQAPVLGGESGGWYTNGGTPIAHPNAYAKHGWSNMQYRTDSRCVTVGRDWEPPMLPREIVTVRKAG